jgi:hypothetical protein
MDADNRSPLDNTRTHYTNLWAICVRLDGIRVGSNYFALRCRSIDGTLCLLYSVSQERDDAGSFAKIDVPSPLRLPSERELWEQIRTRPCDKITYCLFVMGQATPINVSNSSCTKLSPYTLNLSKINKRAASPVKNLIFVARLSHPKGLNLTPRTEGPLPPSRRGASSLLALSP